MKSMSFAKLLSAICFLGLLFQWNNIYGQFFNKSSDGKLDVYINDAVCIGSGGSLYIDGNLRCQDISFESNGDVFLYSSELANILLPSKFSGTGSLTFEGVGDFDVSSPGSFFVNKVIVNTEGTVRVANDFSVVSQLNLATGIVDIALPSVFYVTSSDNNSIVFDRNNYGESYVIGYLGRNTISSEKYYYPIGDNTGAYPAFVGKPQNPDIIVARYDKVISDDAELAVGEDAKILSESGWQIYSENTGNNGYAVGLWAPEVMSSDNPVGILQSSSASFADYAKIWGTENTDQNYLSTTASTLDGYFALISGDDNIDEEITLRNFFLNGNGNSTVFEIPDAETYSDIELTLYNKLGTRLFYADSYTNQLDLANFPTGTYYYELILKKGTNTKKIYNFIEVKNENY